jgi:hypothetical protein
VGWIGQNAGARWSLVIGGLATLICGILALPALSRIDRRIARTRGSEETGPAAASPAETSDDHSPAISSVSPAG